MLVCILQHLLHLMLLLYRDEQHLLDLIREHIRRTDSPLGKRMLESWESYRPKFVKVIPVKEN